MEQKGRYEQEEEGKQSLIPLKCPRCDSFETKFRYFNNHNLKQPRHYCKTCNRLWTVGGNLRNLPIGGHSRNNKQTKVSSSISGNPRPQPRLPSMEEQPHNSQYLTPMGAIIPQHFDTTTMQQYTNQPPIVSPSNSYYFNDEISCLDATQSLIQPQVTNQHVNVGNQFCSGRAEMTLSQEWNPQPMALEQTLPQNPHRHIESYQTLNQAHNAPDYHLNNSLVQPNWPMNTLPQNGVSNFHYSTSNACIGDDFGGNTKDKEMDTTSVDVDQWLDFSGYGPT